jgi:hypothetical protein
LQHRFVGSDPILLEVDANLVVDILIPYLRPCVNACGVELESMAATLRRPAVTLAEVVRHKVCNRIGTHERKPGFAGHSQGQCYRMELGPHIRGH